MDLYSINAALARLHEIDADVAEADARLIVAAGLALEPCSMLRYGADEEVILGTETTCQFGKYRILRTTVTALTIFVRNDGEWRPTYFVEFEGREPSRISHMKALDIPIPFFGIFTVTFSWNTRWKR